MQYIDYLTKQPSDKDAIIINGDRYTYGKLYVLVQDARARLPQVAEKHLYPIRETGILKQLILFLACAGTNQVPVIVPADSKLEVTDPLFDTPVPERAVMAVMTSGFRRFYSEALKVGRISSRYRMRCLAWMRTAGCSYREALHLPGI